MSLAMPCLHQPEIRSLEGVYIAVRATALLGVGGLRTDAEDWRRAGLSL